MISLNTIMVALRALARNKLRACLTVLGIIIGVGAVVATVAIGEGARVSVEAQIKSLGTNLVMVFPGSIKSGGHRAGAGTKSTLTLEDADALMEECSSLSVVSAGVNSGSTVVYANKNWGCSLVGVDAGWLTVRNWGLAEGRFFTSADFRMASKVVILGKTLVDNLFEGASPVGQEVRIRNFPFHVIGVLTSKGQAAWGQDQDDLVVIPLTTAQKRITGLPNINHILTSTRHESLTDQATDEITAVLRRRHRIAEGQEDDFTVRTQKEISDTFTTTAKLLRILLLSVASISLLVGGIGIMNIMLVSVTERTREIGIRMAVGARERDILAQFLVEAVVLSVLGGMIGIAAGAAGAVLVSRIAGWPTLVAPTTVMASFLFSALVGITFGYYPALKASRLDPIEALRYE